MAALLAPQQTYASAFDVQGLGPEGVAEAGARTTSAEDGGAAFFNPGSLALGQNAATLAIAPIVSVATLRAQDSPLPFEDPFGITLTASASIPFEGPLANRLRLGFSGHFLPTTALRLLVRSREQPFYPYYDNRTQRLVAVPALGIRVAKWLGIGFGANVLAGVQGPAKLEKGATGAPEPRIDIAANTVISGIFGIRIDTTHRSRIALVVRQSFGIPLDIDTTADMGGVPLATNLKAPSAMFDPLTIVLASGFDIGHFHVEGDISYAKWSDWQNPFLTVQSTLPGVNLVSRSSPRFFRDTMSFRIGGHQPWRTSATTSLVLRAGIAAEPTNLAGALQGMTNLVDGNKLTLGLGATFAKHVLGKTVRIGFGASGQFVSGFTQDKQPCQAVPCPVTTVAGPDPNRPSTGITNPGYPRLTASGALFSFSLGAGVDL